MPLNEGAKNEILPFGQQGLASDDPFGDLLTLEAYQTIVERIRGHQPGIAKRGVENRALRQALHMGAGVGQFIANRYVPGVVDDGDLDKVEEGLFQAIKLIAGDSAGGEIVFLTQAEYDDLAPGDDDKVYAIYNDDNSPAPPETYWILKRLTANLDIYVAATGNDADAIANGGTADHPFKTIQAAVNFVAENYFLGPWKVTVNVAAGTYTEIINLPQYQTTSGSVLIKGAGKDITYIDASPLTTHRYTILLSQVARYTIDLMTIVAPNNPPLNPGCVFAQRGTMSLLSVKLSVSGTSNGIPVYAYQDGIINVGGYSSSPSPSEKTIDVILGSNASSVFCTAAGGRMFLISNVTANGTVTSGTLLCVENGSFARNSETLPTVTGTITGKRYSLSLRSFVNTVGGGPNYFPGTVAGTSDASSSYN